jgi:hypothetical protein
MHIAVYLRGRHLAEFMEHQPRGLYSLMMGPPPTFYRLLAACIRASNNVFEDDGVRKRLRLVVSSFDRELRSISEFTLDGLHWHGRLERSDTGEGGGVDDDDMPLRQQLIVGLCCMAASAQSRRPHVVTFICFWLLLGPAFSVQNLELLVSRRKFHSDVYNHLAMALATFFVSPDVVFSCLDLAQQNVLATAWECALARQRVFEASSSNRHYRLPVLRLLRAALIPFSRLKRSPCPLGMTKGRVDPNGLLLVGPEERLLSHLLARKPVLAPLILDFGRAATRFHSTF